MWVNVGEDFHLKKAWRMRTVFLYVSSGTSLDILSVICFFRPQQFRPLVLGRPREIVCHYLSLCHLATGKRCADLHPLIPLFYDDCQPQSVVLRPGTEHWSSVFPVMCINLGYANSCSNRIVHAWFLAFRMQNRRDRPTLFTARKKKMTLHNSIWSNIRAFLHWWTRRSQRRRVTFTLHAIQPFSPAPRA